MWRNAPGSAAGAGYWMKYRDRMPATIRLNTSLTFPAPSRASPPVWTDIVYTSRGARSGLVNPVGLTAGGFGPWRTTIAFNTVSALYIARITSLLGDL